LVAAVAISAIAGFTLGWPVAWMSFFVGLFLLAIYVWMLAALRRTEEMRAGHRYVYSDAA
jgi:HAMP domain-containing protein